MTSDRLDRRLDGLGWLELIGIGVALGAVLGLEIAQVVSSGRHETTPGPTAWTTAAIAATVIAVVVMALTAREWRKHGGRRVQRLGRRGWLTGRLPEALPARVATLRDLERRDRKLERSWLPAWTGTLLWMLLAIAHLTSKPNPFEAVTWTALLVLFLAIGVTDFVDRRMRPRLNRLITQLRYDPIPAMPIGLR